MTRTVVFRLALIAAAVISLGTALAQESGFYAWSQDESGAPQLRLLAPGEGYSINRVMREHFPGVRFMTHLMPAELKGDDDAAVIFRWLTDEPLVILTKYPERAAAYVASFDLREFLQSWRLKFALEYADPPPTDLEVLNALGGPSNRITQTSPLGTTERWEYTQYRLVLYFRQGGLHTITTY
jgi:hypothetical protein